MFVGGQVFQVTRISGRDWGISLALGFMAFPIGFLARCVPNEPIERFLIWTGLHKDPNQLPSRNPLSDTLDWNPAINGVRDELAAMSSTRGNRFKNLKIALKSLILRSKKHEVKL
jgi:Ca2+-transporting ATPase